MRRTDAVAPLALYLALYLLQRQERQECQARGWRTSRRRGAAVSVSSRPRRSRALVGSTVRGLIVLPDSGRIGSRIRGSRMGFSWVLAGLRIALVTRWGQFGATR